MKEYEVNQYGEFEYLESKEARNLLILTLI